MVNLLSWPYYNFLVIILTLSTLFIRFHVTKTRIFNKSSIENDVDDANYAEIVDNKDGFNNIVNNYNGYKVTTLMIFVKVLSSPWVVMRILGNQFGYYVPVMPIGCEYHEQNR